MFAVRLFQFFNPNQEVLPKSVAVRGNFVPEAAAHFAVSRWQINRSFVDNHLIHRLTSSWGGQAYQRIEQLEYQPSRRTPMLIIVFT